MKIRIVIVFLSLLIVTSAFAQINTNPISFEKKGGSYQLYQNGNRLKLNKVKEMMYENTEAYKFMVKAKSNYDAAMILSGVGGAMIGWPLGTALGGGEPEWAIAGVGAGLTIFAFILNGAYNKNTIKAVEIYNSGLDESSSSVNYQLEFGLTSEGVGLILHF